MKKVVKEKLLSMRDEKYLSFNAKLCKEANLIGIRVPLLREYAKTLYKENYDKVDWLLKNIDDEYYEEVMLKGMIICLDHKIPFEKQLLRIKEYIPLINSWGTCDTFCSALKITKKHKEEMFKFIRPYFESNDPFTIRFAIVMFLNYYLEKPYMEIVFPIFKEIKSDEYYVLMAISWAISMCLVKEYDYTLDFLENSNLSNFVYKTTIQKAIDSYRISEDQKNYLRQIRNRR